MNFNIACLAVAILASGVSVTCMAAEKNTGWVELKKFASDISHQSSSFHVESAIGQASLYTLDYTGQQVDQIDRLTRHIDAEPSPIVRFGFKSSSNSDASKITQRMLQSLVNDGTIGVSFTW